MAEYRNRTTGEVKAKSQWKADNPNMSLPSVWNDSVLDALNLDPVLRSPAAVTTEYQMSVRDGVEQDANGNWIEKYIAKDIFADTVKDGVTTTKAEHEAAYQARLDAAVAETNRDTRNRLLADTDMYGLSDMTMTAEMTTYRQALRDLPTHANWPNLDDDDWPVKP